MLPWQDLILEPLVAKEVLASIFKFWRSLASLEFLLVSFHTSHMPWLAFTQLSRDEDDRTRGIALMEQMWSKLETVEKAAVGDGEMRSFLVDMGWPTCQFSRELCIGASEMMWARLPQDLRKQVEDVARVASSSKLSEEAFNELRAQVEGVRNGKQGSHVVWQTLASSSLVEDFDLDPLSVTPEHEIQTPDVPTALFMAKQREENVSIQDLKCRMCKCPFSVCSNLPFRSPHNTQQRMQSTSSLMARSTTPWGFRSTCCRHSRAARW